MFPGTVIWQIMTNDFLLENKLVLLDVVTIFVGHQTASPAPFVKFTWQNVLLRMTTSFSVPFPNFFGRRNQNTTYGNCGRTGFSKLFVPYFALCSRGASLKGNEFPLCPKVAFGTPNNIQKKFSLIGLIMNYCWGHECQWLFAVQFAVKINKFYKSGLNYCKN